MKKAAFLPTFTLLLTIMAFTSCERKYCYECTTTRSTVVYPEQTVIESTSASKVHCNQTRSSVDDIEKDGTSYVSYYQNGKLHQIRTVTTCER